jgi:hypothetical protein
VDRPQIIGDTRGAARRTINGAVERFTSGPIAPARLLACGW